MHHVAIMKKSWKLIPKILDGEKTIESRWYQAKRAPWGRIKKGDTVFFKNSGEPIIAQAHVSKVLEYSLNSLKDAQKIVKEYGKDICLVNPNPKMWKLLPNYCILIYLKNPQSVKPFHINKKGFGSAAAWLVLDNVNTIKKQS